jgi:uncharacterized membrane protein
MESRLKVLGHPLHPALVALPLGLLTVGVLFDLLYVVLGDEILANVAYWNITLGTLGGVAAGSVGLVDWLAIPGGTRAKRIGLVHGVGNAVVVVLFAWSWWLRLPDITYAPDPLPLLLGLLGVGLALLTAWLGAELVYRLRVGVDDDAHLDAPSSLARPTSTSPAGPDAQATEDLAVPDDRPAMDGRP